MFVNLVNTGTQRVVDTGGRIEAILKKQAKLVSVHFLLNKFRKSKRFEKVPIGRLFLCL